MTWNKESLEEYDKYTHSPGIDEYIDIMKIRHYKKPDGTKRATIVLNHSTEIWGQYIFEKGRYSRHEVLMAGLDKPLIVNESDTLWIRKDIVTILRELPEDVKVLLVDALKNTSNRLESIMSN
ncbi:MAG: hypothetical protein AABX59_02435 [Nanoarchaeota archaeon]